MKWPQQTGFTVIIITYVHVPLRGKNSLSAMYYVYIHIAIWAVWAIVRILHGLYWKNNATYRYIYAFTVTHTWVYKGYFTLYCIIFLAGATGSVWAALWGGDPISLQESWGSTHSTAEPDDR